MKTLLALTVFSLSIFNGIGQELKNLDSIQRNVLMGTISGGITLPLKISDLPNGNVINNLRYAEPKPEKLDTIPVVMLVCDTSFKIEDSAHYNGLSEYWKGMYRLAAYNPWAYWQYGYSVREKYKSSYWYNNSEPYYYYIHINYLDDKQKPLPSNIIVWMATHKK